jgi:hypothetical protein
MKLDEGITSRKRERERERERKEKRYKGHRRFTTHGIKPFGRV